MGASRETFSECGTSPSPSANSAAGRRGRAHPAWTWDSRLPRKHDRPGSWNEAAALVGRHRVSLAHVPSLALGPTEEARQAWAQLRGTGSGLRRRQAQALPVHPGACTLTCLGHSPAPVGLPLPAGAPFPNPLQVPQCPYQPCGSPPRSSPSLVRGAQSWDDFLPRSPMGSPPHNSTGVRDSSWTPGLSRPRGTL